jgi:hypothetical protein
MTLLPLLLAFISVRFAYSADNKDYAMCESFRVPIPLSVSKYLSLDLGWSYLEACNSTFSGNYIFFPQTFHFSKLSNMTIEDQEVSWNTFFYLSNISRVYVSFVMDPRSSFYPNSSSIGDVLVFNSTINTNEFKDKYNFSIDSTFEPFLASKCLTNISTRNFIPFNEIPIYLQIHPLVLFSIKLNNINDLDPITKTILKLLITSIDIESQYKGAFPCFERLRPEKLIPVIYPHDNDRITKDSKNNNIEKKQLTSKFQFTDLNQFDPLKIFGDSMPKNLPFMKYDFYCTYGLNETVFTNLTGQKNPKTWNTIGMI